MLEVSKRTSGKGKNGKPKDRNGGKHASSASDTPSIPKPLRANAPIPLTENARTVLEKRYLRRGDDGKPVETVEEMFWRVAYHVALAEAESGDDPLPVAEHFYDLLTGLRFFPNSPTFTGAGTPLGQLAACFVLPISDDMGRHSAGIFQTLRDAALIQQTGGGNGFGFGRLRPKGSLVKSSAGEATGPVGFLRVYDKAFGEIAQGGCLLPNTLVFTDRGLLRLDEIADPETPGWREHALQVATDEGWRASPRAFNNGMAPVLRVHTRQGLSLAGTPEHRVKVATDRGPEWRALRDLRQGDWILVRLGQHRGRLQALRQPQRAHGNQITPKLPSVLDEELAFLIGYMTGDGFMTSGPDDHRLGLSVSHSSYLFDEMPALLERVFGVTVHRQQKADDRSVVLSVDNRAVKEFLQINGLVQGGSREARVPRPIRQSPPEVVGAYLRGLFEADGGLSHGYPALTTTSARLAEEVATLLVGLGCPVRVWSIAPGIDHDGKARLYHLRIESTVGLQAWRGRIGCDLRSRFVVAQAWQSDQRRESTDVLPSPRYWLQPVLDAITQEPVDARGRGMGRKFRSTAPRLHRALLRYLRDDRRFTRSAYDELRRAYPEFAQHARSPEGLWFVRVEGVEPAGEALTLDLEVNENHTYLAYGMVTHNTRRGANMAVLPVYHPDVEEFITCKTDENQMTNFNISVGITDDFMRAVKDDADWDLVFPDVNHPAYQGFDGTLNRARAAGIPMRVYKTVRARELFEKIVRQAHHNGEPGVLFLDTANRENPVPELYELEATNPCFVGSTRIATDRGLLTVRDLAESGVAALVATDARAPWGGSGVAAANTLGVAYRPGTPAWMTRERTPVMRLTTRHGYSVVATPDHKFLTADRGYVALECLEPGDRLLLQSGEGAWSQDYRLPNAEAVQEALGVLGQGGDRASGMLVTRQDFAKQYARVPKRWSHALGLALGWLIGDGWLSPRSGSPVGMVFGTEKDQALEAVHGAMREWFGPGHLHERGPVRQLTYGRMPLEFFRTLGVKAVRAQDKRVPEAIWTAPREAVVGFLQGLFTADGTVNLSAYKKSGSIRLASSSRGLLDDVQLLLLNLGIVSRIHLRRPSGLRRMPDGKGGLKEYSAQADHELIIDKVNRDRFVEHIGFADSAKQQKAETFLAGKSRVSNRETFETSVVAVEPAGEADVYDLTEPQTHSVIANGIVTHQCGEQWLGSYENCCLGSINLAQHFGPDGTVDWEKLRESTVLSTRFLDDVVGANQYVPAVPQLKDAAHRARRIGLGIMGLGDLMYHAGIRYGSDEGQEFTAQVVEFVRYHSMLTGIELAEARGPFEAIEDSIYNPRHLAWSPPNPIQPYSHDFGRPEVNWDEVVKGIRRHGIRNACQTTIAPTGTIATVAACESYGCEPVFALAYVRHVNDRGRDLTLTYTSPLFEKALVDAGLDEPTRERIVAQVLTKGSCQDIPEVPEHIRHTFVVSQDIRAEEHVRMQAAMQTFVDNSISKTVNFPADASEADVARAYRLGWELGCKGLTVYVTGTREKVVLETHETAKAKDRAPSAEAGPPMLWQEGKKPRPVKLPGSTYQMNTPLGKSFVTVNENGGHQPFEVFITTAKAGSETAAVSEALGRLISYILRLASPVSPRDRLAEVVSQLGGIGGGRPMGFGPNRVLSLPDGVARALAEYLAEIDETPGLPPGSGREASSSPSPQMAMKIGDLCPDCGEAALVNEEGCRKCYSCGYSMC